MVRSYVKGMLPPLAALFLIVRQRCRERGLFMMDTQKMRAGIRAFGRAILSPLGDVERTVEFAAHWQQHLIRTDALPEMRRERRGTR
jgi:hypothetical protein